MLAINSRSEFRVSDLRGVLQEVEGGSGSSELSLADKVAPIAHELYQFGEIHSGSDWGLPSITYLKGLGILCVVISSFNLHQPASTVILLPILFFSLALFQSSSTLLIKLLYYWYPWFSQYPPSLANKSNSGIPNPLLTYDLYQVRINHWDNGMEENSPAAAGGSSTQQGAPERVEKAPTTVPDIADAPDPDEDDLDDLDDMLDEFSSVKPDAKKPAPTPGPGKPPTSASTSVPAGAPTATENPLEGLDDLSEEEFQKQLQAGMAELMNGLEGSPDMQAQFENIFKGLGAAAGEGSGSGSGSAPKSAEKAAADLSQDASFQETIRRTMARMQESGDQATAAAAAEGSEDDFIAEMIKAMKDLPNEGGNEEDFSKMLMGMMEQLTNKEILYEPMKELNDKFPAWMEKNKDTLPKDDLKRYQEQQVLVAEMVAKFEESTYADSNVADREYIVDRMQKMQAAGSPPHDLVGDMPSAKEVLDAPDESCAPQ
ncbi:Pex19-domain-containing protein [Hypoxylon sp. EC38]|nr:Pex19-domain-containing protein [Hypoxylon sp. EC38]